MAGTRQKKVPAQAPVLARRTGSAATALRDLRHLASPRQAANLMRYFKTGPGEYGEGDHFLGVMVPQTRAVMKLHRDLPWPEVKKLITSRFHEARLCGLLILCEQFKKSDLKTQLNIRDRYLRLRKYINNWDLIDLTAPLIVGDLLEPKAPPSQILTQFAKSTRMWDRRVAVLATASLIRRGDFNETLRLCQMLLQDPEDLMHKATGWMLREVGKRSPSTLIGFLEKHGDVMPRTMLRYSIEHFAAKDRKHFLMLRERSLGQL